MAVKSNPDSVGKKLDQIADFLGEAVKKAGELTKESEKAGKAIGNAGDKAKVLLTVEEAIALRAEEFSSSAKGIETALGSITLSGKSALKKMFGPDFAKDVKSFTELFDKLKAAEDGLTAAEKKKSAFNYEKEYESLKKVYDKQMALIKKEVEAEAKASKSKEKSSEKSKKSTKENTAELKKQIKVLEELKKQTDGLAESMSKVATAVDKGGLLRIRVDNKGFQSIVTEMGKAIENFHKRAEKGDNFFDQQALRQGMVPPSQELKDAVTSLSGKLTKAFESKQIKNGISEAIAKSIQDGVIKGIELGTKGGFAELGNQAIFSDIAGLVKKMHSAGATASETKHAISEILNGGPALTAEQKLQLEKTRVKEEFNAKTREKAQKREIIESEITKRQQQEQSHQQEMERIKKENALRREQFAIGNDPKARASIAKAYSDAAKANADFEKENSKYNIEIAGEKAKQAKFTTEFMMLQLEKQKLETEKTRDWTSRKEAVKMDFSRTDLEMQQKLEDYDNRSLTNMDKLLQKMDYLIAKRHDLEMQARDGVRNTSQQVKNWNDMYAQVKEIAAEQFRININYDDQEKALKKALNYYNRIDQAMQAISNMVSGATRAWNVIGSAINNMFGQVRNNVVRVMSTLRNSLRTTLSEATEQYGKLEQSAIGYTNFFGSEASARLIKQVQREAIIAPALSAGDLADYVMQLAPVSGGNADIALNSALGILKAIQYGGGDASTEMERVVANIRDVISKGKATAIDIRQFNRAMPAITKVLEEMGASEFLKNGQLNITPKNAKTMMEAFARLNTDPASPVRNIFQQMGNTIATLQEAFRERRTQTALNILNKSGAYDLLRGALQNFNNGSLFGLIEDFFTDKLKKVVDFIKTVDWRKIGNALKEGIEKIKDGFLAAKDIVLSSVPQLDFFEVVSTFFTAVQKAIEAFGYGVSVSINTITNLFGDISPQVIEKAASVIGFMMSPVQRLFSTIGSLASSVLSYSQNANKVLSKFTQTRMDKFKDYAEQAGQFFVDYTTIGVRGMENLKDYKNISYDPRTNRYTATNKITGKSVTGMMIGNIITPEDSWKAMNSSQRRNFLAESMYDTKMYSDLKVSQKLGVNATVAKSAVSNVWQRTLNAFSVQLGNIVNGGQLLAFGAGIRAMTDKANVAAQVLGAVGEAFGITMAGRGVGGIIGGVFGNMKIGSTVGTIAGTIVSIYQVLSAWYNAEEERRRQENEKQIKQASGDLQEEWRKRVMEALGLNPEETEIGRYVNNRVLEQIEKTDIIDLLGKGAKSIDDVLQEFIVFGKKERNRYYQSDFMEIIDDFLKDDDTEMSDLAKEFHALGASGDKLFDWSDKASAREQEVRKYLADMARTLGLVSDSDVEGGLVSKATDQAIVEALLRDMPEGITEEQFKMIQDRYEQAEQLFSTDTELLTIELQNSQTEMGMLTEALNNLTPRVEELGNIIAVASIDNMSQHDFTSSKTSAYKNALGKNFDEGTLGLFGNYQTMPAGNRQRLEWELDHTQGIDINELKKSAWYNQSGGYMGTDLITGLYTMLGHKAKEAIDKGDAAMRDKVYKAYDVLDKANFVGLSEGESIKLLAEVIKKIHDIDPSLLQDRVSALGALWRSLGFASGGRVPARNMIGRGVDTVPAFLQPGEFVMRRGSVMKAGLGVMNALNSGDLTSAANALGARLITGGQYNNSRNWSNVTNNNQRTNNNVFNIVNRNMSARMNTYSNLANKIATI